MPYIKVRIPPIELRVQRIQQTEVVMAGIVAGKRRAVVINAVRPSVVRTHRQTQTTNIALFEPRSHSMVNGTSTIRAEVDQSILRIDSRTGRHGARTIKGVGSVHIQPVDRIQIGAATTAVFQADLNTA